MSIPEHCKSTDCDWWKGRCICDCEECEAAEDHQEQAELLDSGEEACPLCGRVLLQAVEGKFTEPVYVRIYCDRCEYQRTED